MRFFPALTMVLCLWTDSAFAQRLEPDWDNWPALVQDRPIDVQENDDELTRLQKECHNACLDELRERYNFWLQGGGGASRGFSLEEVCNNADRLFALRLEMGLTPPEEAKLRVEKLEFAKRLLEQAEAKRAEGRNVFNVIDAKFARSYRLVSEKELLRLRQKQTADGPGD